MSTLKKIILLILILTGLGSAAHADGLTFRGSQLPAVVIEPQKSTGLSEVYVLPYVTGISAEFQSPTPNAVKWQRFSKLGAAYAEDVASSVEGNVSVLSNLEGNMGYAVSDGSSTTYFWVIDHSTTPVKLTSLAMSPSSDCSTTWLNFVGEGDAITYYGITGVPVKVNREFQLTYRTLEFDENAFAYVETERVETLESLDSEIFCTPSLCQTDFALSGDRFTRTWGEESIVYSPTYDPVAVDARTSATQTEREVDNEVREETNLGGSGPVEITFRAAVTDAAIYHEWEFARDPEFLQTYLRYPDLEVVYTFQEQGTTYVRLLAANDRGECEFQSDTYEIYIGESSLKCPNAFSPGASEGVNDEWKVSYKSIIDFDCQIFDRQGRRMAHLTHPSQGWNGKIGGKVAPSGAYYYVIRATGADGKKYKLSGHINIIGFKNTDVTNNATE